MPPRDNVDTEQLKRAFQQAAEVAALVPERMQEAAFNRALDQYLGTETTEPSNRTRSARSAGVRSRTQEAAKVGPGKTNEDEPAKRLVHEIDRTKYPQIFDASRVADRALRVLRLAEEDFGIEWLSAPDIARVLSDKFRLKTSHQAVRNALTPLGQLLDTREQKGGSRGKITVYRLMTPGVEYLDGLRSGDSSDTPTGAPRGTGPKRRKARRTPSARAAARNATKNRPESAVSKRRNRDGPKQSLGALIDDGFFDTPKSIREAQEQLKHKKGVTFTVQELSPALVRLLRDGRLDREQNESGHYEYQRA